MRIKIYTVNQDTGEEILDGECELDDAFERDDPEFHVAMTELDKMGRYWSGGGATPLSLLMRC